MNLTNMLYRFFIFTTLTLGCLKATPHIVVVGAGLSGLTAAYHLVEYGYEVDVYEARDRVGGRVFSVFLNEDIVEIGGQNICDGGDAYYLLRLIETLGLETITYSRQQVTHHWDGEHFIDIASHLEKYLYNPEQLWERLTALQEKYTSMDEILEHLFCDDIIIYTSCGTRLAAYEGATPSKLSSKYMNTLYHQMNGVLCTAHASLGDNSSTISFMQVTGGNALIAERLASLLGDRIHLHAPVCSITYTENGSYLITFDDGSKVTADIIIMTVPCSVYDNIMIDAQIITPEDLATMASITYGTNGKILIPVEGQKIPMGGITSDHAIIWYDKHIQNLTIACVHDAGNFSADTITPLFNQVLVYIQRVYHLPSSLSHPVQCKEQQYARYTTPLAHSWINDHYSRGSYSCIGVGQEEIFTALEQYGTETVRKLFAPRGKFFFAGEHTTINHEILGTMEAAVESAERTVRMIAHEYPLPLAHK